MFTVLHRGPDGSERYYEAANITRFTEDGVESVPPLGRIVLSGVADSGNPSDCVELLIEAPFGAVFVMNRFGATIAKYMLAGKISNALEGVDAPTPPR